MFYEDIKESGACFIFYYMGQDGMGQVVIWGKLELDKLGWDKLTWGKRTCNRFLDGINLRLRVNSAKYITRYCPKLIKMAIFKPP